MPNEDLFKYNVDPGKGLPKSVSLDVAPRQEIGAEIYKEYQGAIGQENIPFDQEVLQEMAYQAQGRPGLALKGIVRGATKILEETLNLPGYAAVPFTGWDNTWLQTIKSGAETFRNVAAPVYMSKAVEEGGIGGKLLDGAWWATTGADGIGFMAAMFVPGAALKALGAGRMLTGAAGAIGRGAEILGGTAVTAADLTNVGNKITGLGRLAKWGKGIQASAAAADIATSGITVAANTYIEAAAEANSSYLNTRDKLMRDNPNMTAEEAERIAGDAAANVFGANLGILGISNYIIERYVFKGFNARASAVNRLKGVNPFSTATEGATTAVGRGARAAAEVGEEAVQAGERTAVRGAVGEGIEATEGAGVRAAGEIAEEGVEEGVSLGAKAARRSSKTGKTLADVTPQSFWKKTGRAIVGGAKGAAVEGGWEEGMQTSAEQYFVNEALRGGDLSQSWNIPGNLLNIAGKWAQNVSEMESTPESREFYEAAVLGGILGGGMTAAGDYSGINDEERILFGAPEVKAREKFMGSERLARGMDRLTNRKPREASPGLIDEFKSKIEASTIKLEDILIPKADGTGYETNKNGTYKIDENKLGAISEAGKDLAISMAQLAAYEQALGDKKTNGTITIDEKQELEKLKHRREMFLLNQYINMEGGAELFDSHAEEIVDKFIEKRFEDSPVPLKPEERVMEIQRLKGKVKRLTKLNEVLRNTHVDNMSVLMQEPGTPEDKQLFSNLRLNQKASQGAYLDNLEQQIKELERRRERVQTVDGESVINQQEAKALNNEIELLEKEKQKAQEEYQDMFNRDKIKESYGKFIKQKSDIEEAQKEIERVMEEFQSPDYIKKLFEEEGYDYENDTDIRINLLDGKDNVSFKIDIEKNSNGERVLTLVSEQGNKFYLTKQDDKLTWLSYDGTQSTPRDVEEEFYQAYKSRIQIEGKERRKERVETEETEFVGEQKELLTEAVDDLVDSMQEQRQKIQSEIDKLSEIEKKIKERISVEELVKNLEKEISELERRKIKGKKIKDKKSEIAKAKEKLEELSKSTEELKNALGKDLNEINEIEERLKKLQDQQKEIDKKINRLVDQKQRIEAIATKEEATNYREYVAKQLIKEAFEKENFSDADLDILASSISVLPATLNEFINNLEKSTKGNFERMFGDVFGKTEDIRNNIEKSRKDLDEVQKKIEETKARIEFLEKKIEAINKDIASKLLNKRSRIVNIQLKEIEEKQLAAENKIQEDLSKRLLEIKQMLDELEARESEITAARKELFDRLVDIKNALEIPKQIVDQIAKTNKRKADDVIKQQGVETVENKEKAIEEESKNRRVPNSPFVLTGIDVLMEGGKDKVDENGNVVLNSNPYQRAWFDFTSDLIMNKEKMSDYEFVITSLVAKDLDPELKTQIEESFRLSPGLTEEQKNTALFVFVKKKGSRGQSYFYKKSGKYVFTSLRSMENIASKFELDAASRFNIRNNMTEENRKNYDNSSEEDKQKMMDKKKQEMIESYKKTLEELRETLKTKKTVKVTLFNTPDVRHLNFRYENKKEVKNKVSEVFPFLFENKQFPRVFVGTTEFVEVSNSKGGTKKIYRIPVGMPFIEVGGIPVILHQNKLNSQMIDTVIALYAEFAGKKGLDQTIEGYSIIENNNMGLLGTLVSYGTGKNNNSAELYIKKGRLVYGLKRDSRSISLDLLKKYIQGVEELTDNEKAEIESLKNYLASRYININKNFVNETGDVVMPVFNETSRTVELTRVNYKKFVFEKVATIPLDKNRPFVQVNFAIDRNSLTKQLVEIKRREEPNDLLEVVGKELISNTTQVVEYANNKLEEEINRLYAGKHKKDLPAVKERLDKSSLGGSYEGVKKYLTFSLHQHKTKEDMLKALDGIARSFIRSTVNNKREPNPKIRIAAMLLYIDRVRTALNTGQMTAGAAAIRNKIDSPANVSEEELTLNQEKEMLNDIFERSVSSAVTEEDFTSPTATLPSTAPMPTLERQVVAQPVISQQSQVGEFVFPRMEGESELDYRDRMFVPFVQHEDKKLRSMSVDERHQYVINTYLTEADRSYFEKDSQENIEKDFTNEIVGRLHLFGFTKVKGIGNGNYRFFYSVAEKNPDTQKYENTSEERYVDFNPTSGIISFFDFLRNNNKPQFNYFLQNLITRYAQQEIDKPLVTEEDLNSEEKKFVEQERERLKKEQESEEGKQSERPTPPSAPVQPEEGFTEIRNRRVVIADQLSPAAPSSVATPTNIEQQRADIERRRQEDRDRPSRESVMYKLSNKIAGIDNPTPGNEIPTLSEAIKIAGAKLSSPIKTNEGEITHVVFDQEESNFRFTHKGKQFSAFYIANAKGQVRWEIAKLNDKTGTYQSVSLDELKNINEKYGSQKDLLISLGAKDLVEDIENFEKVEYSQEDKSSGNGIIPLENTVSAEQVRLSKKYGVTYTLENFLKQYDAELAALEGKSKTKQKIITLDEAKAILKNLEESNQVTKKCN